MAAKEETIYMPPFLTPQKAKFGQPCTGCGWCCHEEICYYGKGLFDLPIKEFVKGPCPAIEYKDGRVVCGLVLMERRCGLEPLIENGLAIGKGCDADDPGTYN